MVRASTIPFEKIAKNMKLEGASASHLKVYTDNNKVYLAVYSEKYNKEAIVASIYVKNPQKANL